MSAPLFQPEHDPERNHRAGKEKQRVANRTNQRDAGNRADDQPKTKVHALRRLPSGPRSEFLWGALSEEAAAERTMDSSLARVFPAADDLRRARTVVLLRGVTFFGFPRGSSGRAGGGTSARATIGGAAISQNSSDSRNLRPSSETS